MSGGDRRSDRDAEGAETPIFSARFEELHPRTLYEVLRLRADVFVVEQEVVYSDLDGRDHEPATVHLWVDEGAGPVAYLRVLGGDGDGGTRIGRVVSDPSVRGRGLASALLDHALAAWTRPPVRLEAQAHLEGWYAGFGFRVSGPGYLEDGIPHVPMVRP